MKIKVDINSVLDIAVEAGHAILEVYNDPKQDFGISLKEDSSPLTIADQIANRIIVRRLAALYPDIPIISEEGKGIEYEDRSGWNTYWCIDPLDGTKEFIKRNGEFTVNIALIKDRVPVLGVIYVPVINLLYYGDITSGSWKKIPGEKAVPLIADQKKSDWIAVGSRSHSSQQEQDILKEYPVNDFIAVGSSLKFCMIAEGKAQIYYRHGPTMEWDTAAGHAIAQFSGCTVTSAEGSPFLYNKVSLLNGSFLCKVNTV